MRTNCPLCHSEQSHLFLKQANVPVHQNLLLDTYEEARSITRDDLFMTICEDCGFVFNSAFNPDTLMYGEHYDNQQDNSVHFKNHLDSIVKDLLDATDLNNCHIVEIGCGKGNFLKRLINEDNGNTGSGFDPSYTGSETQLDGRVNFYSKYYDETCTDIQADVIICRHVIEHVQEPVDMLRQIRKAVSGQKNVRIFFETPCVEWILENNVIWDFFYEHCSLFSRSTLAHAFNLAGFKLENIKHVFNGQYLWACAKPVDVPDAPPPMDNTTTKIALEFSQNYFTLFDKWKEKVRHLARTGNLAIWGAAAKGTTFLNLVDPDQEFISHVIDLNNNKHGRFTAGTGHQIIDYKTLHGLDVRNIILMNPNYKQENQTLLDRERLKINIITQD